MGGVGGLPYQSDQSAGRCFVAWEPPISLRTVPRGPGGQKGPRRDPFPQEQGLHLSALRDLLRS